MENIKIDKAQDESIFDEKMRAKILERQKEIQEHPNDWRDAFEVLEEIRKSI